MEINQIVITVECQTHEQYELFQKLRHGGTYVISPDGEIYFIEIPVTLGSRTMVIDLTDKPEVPFVLKGTFDKPEFLDNTIILGTDINGYRYFLGDVPEQ